MGSSPAQQHNADPDGGLRQPFLATHRAVLACGREFGRLTDEVVQRLTAFHATDVDGKLTVRRSPSRCIVQAGPVALTIAWLRSRADVVAEGELLAMVWRGVVARSAEPYSERRLTTARVPATLIWECVLRPAGASETEWAWHTAMLDGTDHSSIDVAALCVDRLRLAYAEGREAAGDTMGAA